MTTTTKSLDVALDAAETPPPAIEIATRPTDVRTALNQARTSLEAALPASFPGGVDRFERIVLTAVRMVPKLRSCTPMSIIGAAMQAAQLGLTPGVLGEAWILPYRNRDTGQEEAQFQIGWKGMVALANRSGIRLRGATVHTGDDFDYELGLEPRLTHKPAKGDRGEGVYWYAIAHDKTTGQLAGFAVLGRHDVERRRKASKSPNSPAWRDWYDEMALGKAARECCRFLPLTVEMATAMATDGAVRSIVTGEADEYPGEDFVLGAGDDDRS